MPMASSTQWAADLVRRSVERSYGQPLPDSTWDYLVEERFVEGLRTGEYSALDVADHLRRLNKSAPAAAALRKSLRTHPFERDSGMFESINRRMGALSRILAKRATRDVEGFRRRTLPDGLIPAAKITQWIDERYWRSLPRSWPSESGPSSAGNFAGQLLDLPPHVELVWIDLPASTTRLWGVPPQGTLAALARLSKKLSKKWSWSEGHATNFVVSGEVPPRPGVRGVTFKPTRGWDDRYGTYDLLSVQVTIDAEVNPEQLAGWWRGVRDHVGFSNRKPIREKSVRLAEFALDRDETTSWREDMTAWNAQAPPEWHFSDYRNYRTAANAAIHGLNNPASGHF